MGVITWFDATIDGKYKELREAITKWNVKGTDLLQINDVFLKMLGVTDDNDRADIMQTIKRIIDASKPKQIADKVKNGTIAKKKDKETMKLKNNINKLQEANNKISQQHTAKLSEL